VISGRLMMTLRCIGLHFQVDCKWCSISRKRFRDDIFVRDVGELFRYEGFLNLIGDDERVLLIDETTDPFHGVLNHRPLADNLEELFRRLLPAPGPEPRTDPTRHDLPMVVGRVH